MYLPTGNRKDVVTEVGVSGLTGNGAETQGRHSRPRLVHSHGSHAALVAQHLDQRLLLVGGPQADRPVWMSQVDDGVTRILTHHVQSTGLGADGRHLLTHGHVQVLQETCGTLRRGGGG